jgi:hypothetical protein
VVAMKAAAMIINHAEDNQFVDLLFTESDTTGNQLKIETKDASAMNSTNKEERSFSLTWTITALSADLKEKESSSKLVISS